MNKLYKIISINYYKLLNKLRLIYNDKYPERGITFTMLSKEEVENDRCKAIEYLDFGKSLSEKETEILNKTYKRLLSDKPTSLEPNKDKILEWWNALSKNEQIRLTINNFNNDQINALSPNEIVEIYEDEIENKAILENAEKNISLLNSIEKCAEEFLKQRSKQKDTLVISRKEAIAALIDFAISDAVKNFWLNKK